MRLIETEMQTGFDMRMGSGALTPCEIEMMILRICRVSGCHYTWNQHVARGLRLGLTMADIARIALGPTAPGWSARELALLQAAEKLHHDRVLSESTKAMLSDFVSPHLLLRSFYEAVAGSSLAPKASLRSTLALLRAKTTLRSRSHHKASEHSRQGL